MKKTILFLFLFSSNCFDGFSQFIVEIKSNKLNACQDSSVEFTSRVTDGGIPVLDVNYRWSFGDGTLDVSGLNADTVKHIFTKGGGYIVRVDATKGLNSDYALYEFEVALTPNFSGTNTDRKDPFCLGQQVFLTGKIADSTWKYIVPAKLEEENPVLIANTIIFQKEFDYRIFTEDQFISVSSNIDTVGINLEHSNLNDLKIELVCPGGNSIILKNFGGPNKYFGEPVVGGNPDLPGLGYNYYWTNTPDFGTMNSSVAAGESLPSGSYAPEQSFGLLAGCPLNGDWLIKVTDNQLADSGFVFFSQLTFEESLLPAEWNYKHIYSFPAWLGSGVTSTSGTGLATAIPLVHGNHKYTFRVKDNFGCPQDTSVFNKVELPTFTADPMEGEFDLDVNFESTTTWAVNYIWDFDDNSENGAGESATHTYTDDGDFWVQLTAIADDGCQDTAESVLIKVTIPELNFEDMYTSFTPNQQGGNEHYTIPPESANGIESLHCCIYSRWGKKVAEWKNVEEALKGWDGNFEGGKKAIPGVYYYVLKAVGFDGKVYNKNGFFYLFR